MWCWSRAKSAWKAAAHQENARAGAQPCAFEPRCHASAAAAAGHPEKFVYFAGQYIEFLLRDGTRRAYSMANAPHTQADNPGMELHIRHMPGGVFTDQVFGGMKEKDILRVEGPFGSFFLQPNSQKPLIFIASGTGFAPIKPSAALGIPGQPPPGDAVLGRAAPARYLPGRLDSGASPAGGLELCARGFGCVA